MNKTFIVNYFATVPTYDMYLAPAESYSGNVMNGMNYHRKHSKKRK